MSKVNFKNSVIALAIGVLTVSCGGGGNKQSSSASETKAEQAVKINLADHYTAVERPKVEYVEDWMLPADGILTKAKDQGFGIYQFTIGGLNKEQLDKYVKTLEAHGLKKANAALDEIYANGNIQITVDKRSFKEHGGKIETFNNGKNELFEGSYLDVYISKE